MEEYENVKKAGENLERLKNDEHTQYLAWLREKQILDMNSMKKDGFLKGREQGRKEEKREIVRKLLKAGVSEEIIMQTTNITKEELDEIKKEENED